MSDWAVCLTDAEWAWQDDANVVAVLAVLLESAAISSRSYHSETLARGDTITSHAALSVTSGLTVKQVRVALAKLEGAGELESIRRPRGLLIRLLRFEDWQILRRNRETSDRPTSEIHRADSGRARVNPVAESRQDEGKQRAESGRGRGNQRASGGQSHLIYVVNRGFLTTTPLNPPTMRAEDEPKITTAPKESIRQPAPLPKAPSQSPISRKTPAIGKPDLRQKEIRQRLDKLIQTERLPLSPGVIDSLADSPLEFIGLVCDVASEKRDRRSNVVVPTAVAQYRAKQGVQPRPETLERLRRALYAHPQGASPPRVQPRPDCPYCSGAGSVLGERCECVGGRKRTRSEIVRMKLERDDAIRLIREQLNTTERGAQ